MNRLFNFLFACLTALLLHPVALHGQAFSGLAGDRLDVDINGNIYVLNRERNSLSLWTKDGVRVREMGGSGWENNQFDRPSGIWARNGIDVFVADYGNHRIQRFDRNLNYISTLFTRDDPDPDKRFGYPEDVSLSRLGYLFICDGENGRIAKVNQFAQIERTFGGFGAGEGRLLSPTHVACGPKDHVFVIDGERLVVFDNFGNYLHAVEGVFHGRLALFAGESRVTVVDSSTIFCLDGDERVVYSASTTSVCGVSGRDIDAIAVARDSMFVLTGQGMIVVPDPAIHARDR